VKAQAGTSIRPQTVQSWLKKLEELELESKVQIENMRDQEWGMLPFGLRSILGPLRGSVFRTFLPWGTIDTDVQ
jgi:hypothetical protein